MNVFVAGSTGVLGRRLVSRLSERGHDVIGLVRDDDGATLVRECGGTPTRGDVLERDSLYEPIAEVDVVIHAATAIPTGNRPSRADWEYNDRVRLEGIRNLLAAADAGDVDRFVLQSIVWVARQPDGSRFDERAEPNPDRTTRSALESERLLTTRADESDLEACILRGGWFYAHDATHTRRIGRGLLEGRMPIIGGGFLGQRDGVLSTVHADDAADAFVTATETDVTGRYHVVDDRPITYAAFLRTFADQLGASPPRRIPAWLARPLVGRDTVRLLTHSMPTGADRFRANTGWEPSFRTCEAGLDRVTNRWLNEGTIEERDGEYEWVDG